MTLYWNRIYMFLLSKIRTSTKAYSSQVTSDPNCVSSSWSLHYFHIFRLLDPNPIWEIASLCIWKPVSIRFRCWASPGSCFVFQWNVSHCPPWQLPGCPLNYFAGEQKLPVSDAPVVAPDFSSWKTGSLHSVSMNQHWYWWTCQCLWASTKEGCLARVWI